MIDVPRPAEMRLIRRLRALTSGVYLCTILVDSNGVYTISFIGNGKLEKIRKTGEDIETVEPVSRPLEQ